MKKKVLHVINSLTAGGAETLLVNSLAPGGLQEYTDNQVVYFFGTSELEKRIDSRVPCTCLEYTGITSLPATLRRLKRIIKENKIDIVHSHLNPGGLYTHLACPAQVPQVHTIHTTYSMDKETPAAKVFLEKYGYFKKKNSNIILLSEFTKKDFLQAISFTGNAFVLNNFVPDAWFDINPVQQPSLKMIAIGTLKPLKNFEYLLEVFSYLKDHAISLDIYGGGDRSAYEKKISEEKLNIRMMGHAGDLEHKIAAYNMFIMPSKFEGFPLSVFEAMAAGLPLALSDIEPLRSIVKEHAIYFKLDDARETAEQLITALDNSAGLEQMAVKAKAYAEQTVRRHTYIKNLLNIYDQVMAKGR